MTSQETRVRMLKLGAAKLRSDDPGIGFDTLRSLVAQWLLAEAALIESWEPAVEIFNLSMRTRTGGEDRISLVTGEDGEIKMLSDTASNGEIIAAIALMEAE